MGNRAAISAPAQRQHVIFAALDPWTSIYRYLIVLFPLFTLMVGGGWEPGRDNRPRWLLPLRTVVIALLFVVRRNRELFGLTRPVG